VDFNGDLVHRNAAKFFALAQKEGTTGSILTGHRMMGISLLYTGEIVECRPHLKQTLRAPGDRDRLFRLIASSRYD